MMKLIHRTFIPMALMLAAMPAMACDCSFAGDKAGEPTFKDCPKDLTDTLTKSVQCRHLASEFGGDDSKRDRELNRKMDAMKCDQVDAEIAALKTRYKGDKAAAAAIAKTIAQYDSSN